MNAFVAVESFNLLLERLARRGEGSMVDGGQLWDVFLRLLRQCSTYDNNRTVLIRALSRAFVHFGDMGQESLFARIRVWLRTPSTVNLDQTVLFVQAAVGLRLKVRWMFLNVRGWL